MAIGFEFEDGLVEEGGGSPALGAVPAPAFWRRADECPFTVLAGADVLPAGELPDMGRTLGKSVTAGGDCAWNDDSLGMAVGRMEGCRGRGEIVASRGQIGLERGTWCERPCRDEERSGCCVCVCVSGFGFGLRGL